MNDKLNELKFSRNELIQNIENSRNEIARMDADGIPNVGRYNELQSTLSSYQNKLKQVDESISQLENAAGNAQEELTNMFDSFEIGGIEFSLRGLSAGEKEYQIISAFFKRHVGDIAEHNATILQSYKSEIEMLNEGLNELSRVKIEFDEVHRENIDLAEKLIDIEAKRDAAARELSHASEEVARLKADNEKLRNQLNGPSVKVDTRAEIVELAKQIHDAKPLIYDVQWQDDSKKTIYTAKKAETDEAIEIPYYTIKAYRILEGEELARFREEQAQKELERLAEEACNHAETALEVTPPSLPAPNAGVQTDSTNGEVVPEAETVTREEFDALTQRVAHIENNLVRGVA